MKVVSVTNGSLLDTNKINKLDRTGLDVLGLGVESLTEPRKAYGKHLNPNKKELLEQLSNRSFDTIVAIVLNRQNYKDIPNMVEFYNSFGHGASVMMLIPNKKIPKNSPLLFRNDDIPELESVLSEITQMKEQGFRINEAPSYFAKIPDYVRGDFTWKCTPGLELSVMNDGKVNLCTDMCITEDTIFEIEDREDFINIIEKNRHVLESCKGCLWDYKMKPTESVLDPKFRGEHSII